jgi:hypothetical protein
MRYLRKYNESKGDIKDLDWSFIKDCLVEVFDSVDNIKGQFHFYSCNFNGGRKDDWYWSTYKAHFASKPYTGFGYNYTGIKDIFNYDPETSKRENQPEDGDIFLRSYPKGSGLWGIEFVFELDSFPKVSSISDLDSVTNYFDKCKNISDDISSTIERLGKYDYRIGLHQSLIKSVGVFPEECYIIKLSIWDKEIREIMEKENTGALETDNSGKIIEINWIN